MKTVRDACQLQPDALSITLSDQVEQLDDLIRADLAADEVYAILRKRLFARLPDQAEIRDIAEAFRSKLTEAAKSRIAGQGAEALADEIAATYPFHPRLKNIVALFKGNEPFRQTRDLLELVSRLLRSVWERPANDVLLIGAQHFNPGIPEVREKLTEISGMHEVIAKDLWDAQQSAHAQVIDRQNGNEAATQVAGLLLTASLSTAVNAVKGLNREEMVECLVSPLRELSAFLNAFEAFEKVAWYLHHTPERRWYFDRQVNLIELLQSLAQNATDNQVDDLIRDRLRDMFRPLRKTCYEEVIPLPKPAETNEVSNKVCRGRVLLVVCTDSKIPPEQVQRLFEGLTHKNNLCVLTVDRTAMKDVEKAARLIYAAQQADIPTGDPQREDLERFQRTYKQDFDAAVLRLFDKVLFPMEPAQLAATPLDMTRDATKPFAGEEQIEKTLIAKLKLYLDVERDFDALRDKAESLLWPENQDEARWSDCIDRFAVQPGMSWLPPDGLNTLKAIACKRRVWKELKNGYVTRRPKTLWRKLWEDVLAMGWSGVLVAVLTLAFGIWTYYNPLRPSPHPTDEGIAEIGKALEDFEFQCNDDVMQHAITVCNKMKDWDLTDVPSNQATRIDRLKDGCASVRHGCPPPPLVYSIDMVATSVAEFPLGILKLEPALSDLSSRAFADSRLNNEFPEVAAKAYRLYSASLLLKDGASIDRLRAGVLWLRRALDLNPHWSDKKEVEEALHFFQRTLDLDSGSVALEPFLGHAVTLAMIDAGVDSVNEVSNGLYTTLKEAFENRQKSNLNSPDK